MKLHELTQLDEMHPMTSMMMSAMGDKNPEKTMADKKKEDKKRKEELKRRKKKANG